MSNSVEYLIDINARMQGGNTVSQLTEIERAMKKEEATIKTLESAMKRIGNSSNVDAAKMQRFAAATEASRQRLAGLAESYAGMAKNGGTATAKAAEGHQQISGGLAVLAQRFGISAEQANKFGSAAGIALGVFAAGKVIGVGIDILEKVASAFAHAGKQLAMMGMHEADRAANARITYEAYTRSAIAAKQLDHNVAALSDRYGVGQKTLDGYAIAFLKAGLRGQEFNDAMRVATIKAAAFGEEAVDVNEIVGKTPDALHELAKATETAYGSTALKRGQTFEAGIERIKRRVGELMASPALQGGLANLFNKIEKWLNSSEGSKFFDSISTSIGEAATNIAKFIGTSDFNSLADDVKNFARTLAQDAPKAIPGLMRIAQAATKIANALTKVMEMFDKLDNMTDFNGSIHANRELQERQYKQTDSQKAGRKALGDQAMAASGGDGAKAGQVVHAYNEVLKAGGNEDQARLAGQLVGIALGLGMLAGMKSQEGAVTAGGAALSAAAKSGAKSEAKIQSPSKVFARLGGFVAQGFAQGIDDGAPTAESAMADMVQPPKVERAGRSGARVTFGDLHFHGVEDAEGAVHMLEERITALLEGVVLEGGPA